MEAHTRFPIAPGFLIGVAVTGFFDGMFLHQILQWHHMICVEAHCVFTRVESLTRATLTDGIFQPAMWGVLLIGLGMFTSAISRRDPFTNRRFWGSVLLGAGIFNVLEGIIDHHILQIH